MNRKALRPGALTSKSRSGVSPFIERLGRLLRLGRAVVSIAGSLRVG
jgi:hypothetical protein